MRFEDFKDKKKFSYKVVIPALIENNFMKLAEQLKACGNFKSIAVCERDYSMHFNGANSCKSKFCPVCQKKRSMLWLAKLYPIFDNLIEKKYYVNFVTFTIKNTESLQYGIDTIYKAFRYLQGKEKGLSKQFNDLYIGGIRSLEVKRGSNSGLWHPHLHMLVVKNSKSAFKEDYAFLIPAWQKALEIVTGVTGIELGRVDIRAIKFHPKYKKESLIKAITETFKYMTKSEWPTEDTAELVPALQNVRGINSWGNIRYFLSELNSEKDIEESLNKKYTDIKKHVCATCGHDGFIIFEHTINTKGHIIYDFEDAYMPDEEKQIKIKELIVKAKQKILFKESNKKK